MDPSKLPLVWQWMGGCALTQVVLSQYMTVPSLVAKVQLHSLTIWNIQNGFVSRVYIHIKELSSQMRISRSH